MANKVDKIADLLIERATRGLTSEQERHLAEYFQETGEMMAELTDYDRAVAAVDNAIAATHRAATSRDEPLPESLRRKLAVDAERFFDPGKANVVPLPAKKSVNRTAIAAFGGWAVAAALLILVLIGQLSEPTRSPPDHAALVAELTTEADTITAPWIQPDAPDFRAVTGEVIWNDRLQAGYMRLNGMPANAPDNWQYQLWIVDPDRDERPVDGGVFDIPDATTEWLIPIDAKLSVDRPTVFAITREKPGGVVVSDGPLLVIASV